jgi:hypothetical protein
MEHSDSTNSSQLPKGVSIDTLIMFQVFGGALIDDDTSPKGIKSSNEKVCTAVLDILRLDMDRMPKNPRQQVIVRIWAARALSWMARRRTQPTRISIDGSNSSKYYVSLQYVKKLPRDEKDRHCTHGGLARFEGGNCYFVHVVDLRFQEPLRGAPRTVERDIVRAHSLRLQTEILTIASL